MGIIGARTVDAFPPHATEDLFQLLPALSWYHCERIRQRTEADARRVLVETLEQAQRFQELGVADAGVMPSPDEQADRQREQAAAFDAMSPRERAASRYDPDHAAAALVVAWPDTSDYQDAAGSARPVDVDTVRMLDAATREWLHERAWKAMRPVMPKDVLEGNS